MKYGRLDIIKKMKFKHNALLCSLAACYGQLEILKWAHENGYNWDEQTMNVSAQGHLDCLKYAHENGCPWGEYTCLLAIVHIDALRYARDKGCPWNNLTLLLEYINN